MDHENEPDHVRAETYGGTFEWSDPDQPSAELVRLLADLRNVDPYELEPLHNYIDTDSLNSLMASTENSSGEVAVTFQFDGYEVRIDSSGKILAVPIRG